MTAPAAARHDRDGADLRTGDTRAVMRERVRHVGAGAMVAGFLKHHVHEARAPQTAAAGRIAADIAARLGHEARATAEAAAARRAADIRLSGHPTSTPHGSTAGARGHLTAGNHSSVAAHGHSTAAAHGHSTAAAHGYSSAAARGDAAAI